MRNSIMMLLILVGATFIISLLANSTSAIGEAQPATAPTRSQGLYEEFETDVALLRDTQALKQPDNTIIRGSSTQAQESARHIFSRVAFLHRTRAEVLGLLGDPETVSDYGVPADEGDDQPLVYNF